VRALFPEANLKERLGSELNDPSMYQPLFCWDLFDQRKIKELIDTGFKFKNQNGQSPACLSNLISIFFPM
jgi:hypothetical protein